jgi:lipopolysaccharide transport system ATP-binding protein
MTGLALRAEALGKQYQIGGPIASYGNVRESLLHAFRFPVRQLIQQEQSKKHQSIWALRNVSFEVKHGEALGVIGPNGAGKSTLLKILSRITEPTEGRAEVFGRVASLLEVGTGFHPELSGRENIFLNGSILGMSRLDIQRRFDEIVEFAGIEGFLDTPVKRYSSGMYVRLAFAVAAHLEPDVLVIDEVLAVGDAEFQKKCLGKMGSVAREGRTVLFVSHNLQAVTDLCSRAIVLDHGTMIDSAPAREAVIHYLTSRSVRAQTAMIAPDRHVHEPDRVCFTEARTVGQDGEPIVSVYADDPIHIHLRFSLSEPIEDLRLAVAIESVQGVLVAVTHSTDRGKPPFTGQSGQYEIELGVHIPLAPGTYIVHLAAKQTPGFWGAGKSLDWVQDATRFDVESVDRSGAGVLPVQSSIIPRSEWSIQPARQPSVTSW